jgi:hypothetical protein
VRGHDFFFQAGNPPVFGTRAARLLIVVRGEEPRAVRQKDLDF